MPRGQHPNSRAAIEANQFKSGDDPRRSKGAPSLARQITAAWNELARETDEGFALYDVETLKAIVADGRSSHAKASAANLLLACREQGWDKINRQPKALAALNEILDRLIGKPTQQIVVTAETRPHSEILDDLARHLPRILAVVTPGQIEEAIRQRPELAAVFQQAIGRGPIDTTAALIEDSMTPEEMSQARGNDLPIRDIEAARHAHGDPAS